MVSGHAYVQNCVCVMLFTPCTHHVQAKKPKKKKPRFPVGYDPSLPNGGLPLPDPERWLPKWQRAEAKKKAKKRRDKEAVKGSQVRLMVHSRRWPGGCHQP